MAEPTPPKKETVRIILPPPRTAGEREESHDRLRPAAPEDKEQADSLLRSGSPEGLPRSGRGIVPPPPSFAAPKPPAPSASHVSSSAGLAPTPLPRPPAVTAAGTAALEEPVPVPISQPKTDTSRISLAPDSPKSAAMRKTQPLVTLTATPIAPPPLSVNVAMPERPSVVSTIPTGLCWALLLISVLILLIEIWTYIS